METKKILLADPSEPVRKVIVNAFEDEDLELITADDFDSAVEKIATEAPLLILAGISLPGKNGYALCEYVKGTYPLIPVVMLVGTDETLDSEEALRVGADDYFIRPFKSQDLIEKIGDLLSGSAQSAGNVVEGLSASAQPLLTGPDISNAGKPAMIDVDEPAMLEVDEPATAEVDEPAIYGELPSVAAAVETPQVDEQEVDITLAGLKPNNDINESSEAFLADMGIEEDEDLDVVFGNVETDEKVQPVVLDQEEEEGEDILKEFLSDIDDTEVVETEIDDIIIGETKIEEPLIDLDEIETNEVREQEVEAQVDQTDEVKEDEIAIEEISFNDDAVIDEPEITGEVSGVGASTDEKGVAVEGIVEISKAKIEELIINNTREDVKSIAYELVPGLAKDPIAVIVPEAVKKASERLVNEIVAKVTGQVAEGIIKDIAAEITSQKAAEHIAQIASDAVMKAAEERIKEIATEAAEKAANEIISALAEKTTIDVAEKLITGEIKSFKTKLSKEG